MITRPWATPVHSVDGEAGHFYDLNLHSHERILDYERLLEATRPLHSHFAHICLGHMEDTVRLTVPTVLGSRKIIEVLEQFLESARYCVSRSRNPIASAPDKLADEWPEHVIGPRNPLTFLGPGMKCSFFSV